MFGGHFRLDAETAPRVVAELSEAREHLVRLLADLAELPELGPVGADEVSRMAVAQFQRLGAGDEPGSLATVGQRYLTGIDAAIDAQQTMIGEYRRADEFVPPPGAVRGRPVLG